MAAQLIYLRQILRDGFFTFFPLDFIYIVLEASAKIFKRKNVNYRGLFIHIIESQLKRNKIQF